MNIISNMNLEMLELDENKTTTTRPITLNQKQRSFRKSYGEKKRVQTDFQTSNITLDQYLKNQMVIKTEQISQEQLHLLETQRNMSNNLINIEEYDIIEEDEDY